MLRVVTLYFLLLLHQLVVVEGKGQQQAVQAALVAAAGEMLPQVALAQQDKAITAVLVDRLVVMIARVQVVAVGELAQLAAQLTQAVVVMAVRVLRQLLLAQVFNMVGVEVVGAI